MEFLPFLASDLYTCINITCTLLITKILCMLVIRFIYIINSVLDVPNEPTRSSEKLDFPPLLVKNPRPRGVTTDDEYSADFWVWGGKS